MPRTRKPGSAAAAIDVLFGQSRAPMTRPQINEALAYSGHSQEAIGCALKEGVSAGNYLRHGQRRPFTYQAAPADHSLPETPRAGGYTGPAFDRGPIGPTLGVLCYRGSACSGDPATVIAAMIDAALDDDIGYSIADIEAALNGRYTRQQLADGLRELVHMDRVRGELDPHKRFVYVLQAPETADTAPARAGRAPSVDAHGDPPAMPPGALRERVASIAADLEDAIGDACDAGLSHGLIKALTAASGATHRAALELKA